jgi:signal transduction histidine kinase
MAEVATNVLHNVGNVLNSVNVSVAVAEGKIRKSSARRLGKVVALLRQNQENLAEFLTHDEKGQRLIEYLDELVGHLNREEQAILEEFAQLGRNVEHINRIVSMQQNYARVAGVTELVNPLELAEDALRMNSAAYERHSVRVTREFAAVPNILVDRHKAMQILLNLIQNAKHACSSKSMDHRQVTMRVSAVGADRVKFETEDNGEGIPEENLTRIFSHGFTTRKEGHGFGLHSGALAAKEMGGSLTARSGGPGQGAVFTLELPVQPRSVTVELPDAHPLARREAHADN